MHNKVKWQPEAVCFIGGSNETFFGLGAKFQYGLTDPIRLEGSFLWFFPKTKTIPGMPAIPPFFPGTPAIDISHNLWDFNVNAHYLFPISGTQLTVYPLAGLGFTGFRGKVGSESNTETRFGFNLGGGLDFPITETITLNFEARYKLVADSDFKNLYFIGLGAAFRF